MAKMPRRMGNAPCPEDQDPNALPLVSAKDSFGGKATTLTAVLIDGAKAWFDEAAVHGRTPLEQKVKWEKQRDAVPNGRKVNVVWLFIKPVERGSYQYFGVAGCEMFIDETAGVGYKNLADHVNRMSKAIAGQIDLSQLDDRAKKALAGALGTYPEVLENSSAELKMQLGLAAV